MLKKILSAVLALTMVLSLTACGESSSEPSTPATQQTEDSDKVLDTEPDYENMADIGEVDSKNEEGAGPLYEAGKTAGTVNALCYYDIAAQEYELAELFATRFGGILETEITTSGSAYFEKMGTLIASGDSPDLVRYDWMAYPCGVSKNQYTALDQWLDIESPIWSDIRGTIDSFAYAGKHYYFPSGVMSNFAIHYNKVVVDEAGLPDPLELYLDGNWNWDTFEDLCKKWVDLDENHIGFTGGSWSAMMFVNSTGTKVIDMTGTEIVNNLRNENVQRTMDWLADMKKNGLIGDGYVHPGEAFIDGNLLFLGMGLVWGHEASQEQLFKSGIENEMIILPMPKDPNSDKYYVAADTFGYMVPAGAKNIQGAVSWILASRIYETDEEVIAAERSKYTSTDPIFYPKCPDCKYNFVDNGVDDLTVCPECNAARKEKFKPYYSELQYQIIDDITKNPDKFTPVYDNSLGFDDDFSKLFIESEDSLYDGPLYYATKSFTQLRDASYDTVESYLEPYRTALAESLAENN